jgi:hypothetical protein
MNWVTLIFAVVAAAAAAGFWWALRHSSRELALMKATATSKAADVAAMAAGTLVAVKGVLRAPAPLKATFSGRDCVYFRSLTEREVERTRTDNEGRRETDREFETESDVVQFAPATVEDGSGAVAIDFTSAKVEAEQVHRHQEYPGVGQSLIAQIAGAGTLSHRFTEWIVAAGVPVYVLGTVSAAKGIGADPAKRNPLVISIKSEEEREKALGRTRIWQIAGIAVCAVIAVVLLYVTFTSGPPEMATSP